MFQANLFMKRRAVFIMEWPVPEWQSTSSLLHDLLIEFAAANAFVDGDISNPVSEISTRVQLSPQAANCGAYCCCSRRLNFSNLTSNARRTSATAEVAAVF